MFENTSIEQKACVLWDIESQWNRGESNTGKVYSVGESIEALNTLKSCLGPHRKMFTRVCNLLDDIVANQSDEGLPPELLEEIDLESVV